MANISVQFRRGTDTEHSSFTGAEGEVTVDTTNDTLRVHDGTTAGGVRLAKLSEANVQSDWNETNTGSTAFILNKPTIPTTTDPVPTGTVSAFAGSAAPTGYVLCDGAEYDETTEASLFAVLSTTYNTGGETANHFRVPDLQGRVIAGMGGSLLSGTDAVGDEGGVKEHTLLETELPAHDHLTLNNNAGNSGNNVTATNSASFSTSFGGDSSYIMRAPSANPIANIGLSSETGGDSAHPNVQPTIILNYIIKT